MILVLKHQQSSQDISAVQLKSYIESIYQGLNANWTQTQQLWMQKILRYRNIHLAEIKAEPAGNDGLINTVINEYPTKL